MKHTTIRRTTAKTLLLAIAMAFTATPWAQSPSVWTRAEVRKIDTENGKITLKHEEIKNLDMPPMTMVFLVKDKALLQGVQTGDAILFVATSDNGKLVVTDIRPAKP